MKNKDQVHLNYIIGSIALASLIFSAITYGKLYQKSKDDLAYVPPTPECVSAMMDLKKVKLSSSVKFNTALQDLLAKKCLTDKSRDIIFGTSYLNSASAGWWCDKMKDLAHFALVNQYFNWRSDYNFAINQIDYWECNGPVPAGDGPVNV